MLCPPRCPKCGTTLKMRHTKTGLCQRCSSRINGKRKYKWTEQEVEALKTIYANYKQNKKLIVEIRKKHSRHGMAQKAKTLGIQNQRDPIQEQFQQVRVDLAKVLGRTQP